MKVKNISKTCFGMGMIIIITTQITPTETRTSELATILLSTEVGAVSMLHLISPNILDLKATTTVG